VRDGGESIDVGISLLPTSVWKKISKKLEALTFYFMA
jgi:hypothetical protein